ncbi:MAG: hypothetical protein KGD60_13400 [Candidatus Thorarchaeota archaeon]|nr:hypothetical protein [Candidatus Thorarchaeota archaeon]
MSVWEVTQFRWSTNGTVRVLEDGELLIEEEFSFLPHWQETPISVSIPGLEAGRHDFIIEVENEDGMVSSINVSVNIPSNILLYGGIAVVVVVVVIVIVNFFNKRRK